jgi:hypothetical protein
MRGLLRSSDQSFKRMMSEFGLFLSLLRIISYLMGKDDDEVFSHIFILTYFAYIWLLQSRMSISCVDSCLTLALG